jgi:phenylacetate-coenzyme A ligase PaaK-like adenylate-forming protein
VNIFDLNPGQQREYTLQRLFRYLREYVEPYHPHLRRLYREQGIDVKRLNTADDLRRLPIVEKDALRNDPLAFILQPTFPGTPSTNGFETAGIARSTLMKYIWQAASNLPREYSARLRQPSFKEKIRRRALMEWLPVHFHVSTGTTGNPTPATYTWYDLNRVMPRLASILLLPKQRDPEEAYYDWTDRTMNIFPGAPHLAFFSPVLAKSAAGISTFDTFGGSVVPTDRQITVFASGGFSSMTAVPSYLAYWLRRAIEMLEAGEIAPLKNFKRVVVGAEPLSETMREYIRSLALKLGAHPRFRIYQTLGMTEMKWAFLECSEKSGIHLNPEFYYWELLDPKTREPVPEGEPGVLVFSHIDWRGTVLIRYWTGDLIKGGMRWERCEHCGWTFPRIFPPICRAEKDFTKIKGTRVDLTTLIESIRDTPGVRNFQVMLENENSEEQFSRDVMSVYLLPEPNSDQSAIEQQLRKRVKLHSEVTPDRVIFEHDETEFNDRLFARTGIKADYVVERRKLHI